MSRDKAIFQSTRPVRGATTLRETARRAGRFQSTRPVWARQADRTCAGEQHYISIHAPRAGRDAYFSPVWGGSPYFNPRAPCGARRHVWQYADGKHIISNHAPRAGRDLQFPNTHKAPEGFQSTRPVRGATASGEVCTVIDKFQSTRPVRGATANPA